MKKRILAIVLAAILLLMPALALAQQYLIEDSDRRQLTEAELWRWDYETLGYILNEIFARHGYVFNAGGDYEAYFTQRPWYSQNASADNQTLVYDKLSTLEWVNERLVKTVRQTMRDNGNFNTGGLNWRDVIGSGDTTASAGPAIMFSYASFQANQKFDVYAAPGTSSWRGASGKAAVSTNGPVYVAGWDGNWLLVMYDTNAGAVRVGYINGNNISGGVSAPGLSFAYLSVTLTSGATLTDDPVTKSTAIVNLSAGNQVTYLAEYSGNGSWAYVETQVSGKTVRGFIPMSAIQ
jgi:hypothetical protein